MKVLNICRFLPIESFPEENDISLKIYSDLKKKYGIKSVFIMPISYIPKYSWFIKNSLRNRYKIINSKQYYDKNHKIKINFFQGWIHIPFKLGLKKRFLIKVNQFAIFKKLLFKEVDIFQPNLIHAHTIEDAYYAYKIYLKYNIPYVITLRGSKTEKYDLQIASDILANAKHLITPSFELWKSFKYLYEIQLMPHGIDEEWFLKEQKYYDSNKLRLVTVSRIIEMKNIQVVLKSLVILKKNNIKFSYDIIGDGSYKSDLESLVGEIQLDEEVKFHGRLAQNEIQNIISNYDIFIMLSDSETFGRAYFEAAAKGLLVIGTKDTGLDGYFTNRDAFLVHPEVSKLVEVLNSINSDVFYQKTKNSIEKVSVMKNEKILNRYRMLIESSLESN